MEPVQDGVNRVVGVLERGVGRVALLPQELAGAQERRGLLELPPNLGSRDHENHEWRHEDILDGTYVYIGFGLIFTSQQPIDLASIHKLRLA